MTLNGLESRALWLTVWHSDMFGRNDFLGEVRMPLENKIFDDPRPQWYPLQERVTNLVIIISFEWLSYNEHNFLLRRRNPLTTQSRTRGRSSWVWNSFLQILRSSRSTKWGAITETRPRRGRTGVVARFTSSWRRPGTSKRELNTRERVIRFVKGNGNIPSFLFIIEKSVRYIRQLLLENSFVVITSCFCTFSYLLPDKGRSGKQKTGVVRRSDGSPAWNHTFVYKDVSLQELSERGLELTVWDHDRIASNEFLGGVRFNLGSGKILCFHVN